MILHLFSHAFHTRVKFYGGPPDRASFTSSRDAVSLPQAMFSATVPRKKWGSSTEAGNQAAISWRG